MFAQYAHELLKVCEEEGVHLDELSIRHEAEESDLTKEEVLNELREILKVMKLAATEGKRRLVFSVSGLIGGDSTKISAYSKTDQPITGSVMTNAMAYAMSCSEVNASMGRIVAAPTAGACGILPAVLKTFSDRPMPV